MEMAEELEPITGVSLAAFVAVTVELVRFQFDGDRAVEVAGWLGIPPAPWAHAASGWTERLRTNPAVADEFARLYRQRRRGQP